MSHIFKSTSITNGYKKYSPIPAGNSSLDFSLFTAFLLLPSQDYGPYGVLFDDGWKDMPLDVSVNVNFVFL